MQFVYKDRTLISLHTKQQRTWNSVLQAGTR